jgi:hypothetical protein
MTKAIKTDIDLSSCFGEVLAEEYQAALDYLILDPASALVKFRIVTELLCKLMAGNQNIIFESDSLIDRIDELFANQIIHNSFKESLHQVRGQGNKGAHNSLYEDGGDEEYVKRLKAEYRADQELQALSCRKSTIENLKDAYAVIHGRQLGKSIEIVKIEGRSWEKDLIEAAVSVCPITKLKAGKVYESLAIKMRINDSFNMSHAFEVNYDSHIRLAAINYEASYKLSADVDNGSYSSVGVDQYIKHNCDSESLFLYWRIVTQSHFFGKEKAKEYEWVLEHLATKGYSPAKCEYGKYLYDAGDYEQALLQYCDVLTEDVDARFPQ